METRQTTPEDFAKFLPLKESFVEEYRISKKSEEFIKKEFENFLNKIFLLAIEDGEILGYLFGEIEESSYEKFGYLSEIFVKKETRRKGIATALKDRFIKILKEKGIEFCRVEVNPSNLAEQVYKSWGFNVDKHRMRLDL